MPLVPQEQERAGRRGRPPGPQRAASRYVLKAVLARSGLRERDLRTGFTGGNAALTRNINGLVKAGWLQAKHAKHQGDRTLTLGPQAGHLIGIGVGRELLRVGIYRPDGQTITHVSIPRVMFPMTSDEALPPAAFRALLRTAFVECRRQLEGPIYPLACGVAWPSRVSRTSGEPQPLRPRPGWSDISVKTLVAEALRDVGIAVPITILNDADAEAVAEARLGVARNASTALIVKLAGGVGAAVVHRGEVLSGARGFAGEIGHVQVAVSRTDARLGVPSDLPATVAPLDPGLNCTCGIKGHLQTMVSVAAVVDRLGPGLAAELGSYLEAVAHLERTVPAKVIDLVMYETGVVLGRALCAPVAILDPDVLVLRSLFFPTRRLVEGVVSEFEASSLAIPAVRLGTQVERGRWMGAQGAALVVADHHAVPRVKRAQENWRDVESITPVSPIPSIFAR